MNIDYALALMGAGLAIWYYLRIRLIAFTEPMRVRLRELADEIELHPDARPQDIQYTRVLGPRALSNVFAWALVFALVSYYSRSAVSVTYREKLQAEFMSMPKDYAMLIAEFTDKFTKSVFSNAPIAWCFFRTGMMLGRLGVLLRQGTDVNSMNRIEDRILVTEKDTLLKSRVTRMFEHSHC